MRIFALLLAFAVSAVALGGCTSQPPPHAVELSWAEFNAGWDEQKRQFSSAAGLPLYASADVRHFAPSLTLLRASPEPGKADWLWVPLPARRELTPDLLERLSTITTFTPEPWLARLSRGLHPALATLLLLLLWRHLRRISVVARQSTGQGSSVRIRPGIRIPLVSAAVFYWLCASLHDTSPASLGDQLWFWRGQMFEQGPIPKLILWTTAFGLASLWEISAVYGSIDQKGMANSIFPRLRDAYLRHGDVAGVQRLRDEILEEHERRIHLAFTSVKMTEWILPVGGFLGTVWGLGQALGQMRRAIRFGDNGVEIARDELSLTFDAMSLSFYTTLFGLVGMLSIALTNFLLRSRLDKNLTHVSELLTEALEHAAHTPADVRVVAIQGDTTQRSVAELQRQQESAAELILRCFREDPALYERFGSILFQEYVAMPAHHEEFARALRDGISARLDTSTWRVSALVASSQAGVGCVALVDDTQHTGVVAFDVDPQNPVKSCVRVPRIDRVLPCAPGAYLVRLVGRAQVDSMYWLVEHASSKAKLNKTEATLFDSDVMLPIHEAGRSGALLIHGAPEDRRIDVLWVGEKHGRQLDAQIGPGNFTLGALSPDGALLALAGDDGAGRGRVTIIGIQEAIKQADKRSNTLTTTDWGTGEVSQVCWLSKHELILVTLDGELLLFNTRQRNNAERLTHERWRKARDTHVCPGPQRWLAVFQSRELSMWRVTITGGLVPSLSSARIPAASVARPRVAAVDFGNGRGNLLGASEQLVSVWDFPHAPSASALPGVQHTDRMANGDGAAVPNGG